MKLEIKEYRKLSLLQQEIVLNNYKIKLSQFKEAYTKIDEIKNAIGIFVFFIFYFYFYFYFNILNKYSI